MIMESKLGMEKKVNYITNQEGSKSRGTVFQTEVTYGQWMELSEIHV